MLPPEPPTVLNVAAGAWRLTALGLGLSIGLVFLGLGGRRDRLRELVLERAPDLSDTLATRATTIVLFGTPAVWALLAIAALFLARGVRRPTPVPRLLGIAACAVLLVVLALTAVPLSGDEGFGLLTRVLLAAAGLSSVAAVLLAVLPGTWRFVRVHRDGSGARPASAPRHGRQPPSPGR